MNAKTLLAGTSIALALAAAAATPANALVTEFATFSPILTYNVYYNNPSSTLATTAHGADGGTGKSTTASFYTIATPTSKVIGAVPVTFSFLNVSGLDSVVDNVKANFTLSGTTTAPAQLNSFHQYDEYTSGSFSFVSTAAYTVGSTHYAKGDVLLAGTFTQAILSGSTTTGNLKGDNVAAYLDTLTYTSDFLNFIPGAALGYSFSLSSIFPGLSDATSGTYALKTFKTDVGGQFTSDPNPTSNAVPEPASWALMMVGFGLAGASIRRRVRVQATAV